MLKYLYSTDLLSRLCKQFDLLDKKLVLTFDYSLGV